MGEAGSSNCSFYTVIYIPVEWAYSLVHPVSQHSRWPRWCQKQCIYWQQHHLQGVSPVNHPTEGVGSHTTVDLLSVYIIKHSD